MSLLLSEQGDARLALDPESGRNRYGCLPFPGPRRPAFGSATASTISPQAFEALKALHQRVGLAPGWVQAAECDRVRAEIATLCGADSVPGSEVVLAPSGTDVHLLAAQLCASDDPQGRRRPLEVVLSPTEETGNGVPAALRGLHYNDATPFQGPAPALGPLDGCRAASLRVLAGRRPDGRARPIAEVDAEARVLVEGALSSGADVLLVVSDLSKTGLVFPSPGLAADMVRRHGGSLTVLIDACQLRLGPAAVRGYLEAGCAVGVTGSKFATGPAFSGALLVPPALAGAWRERDLAPSLSAYSARADWPKGWRPRGSLTYTVNTGLLFRWQAALTEMRAFRLLDPAAVAGFFSAFAVAVGGRLAQDPAFGTLDLPAPPARPGGGDGWDQVPTLLPFVLKRGGSPLPLDPARALYKAIREGLGEIGQPVAVGGGGGSQPLGAFRMCSSMRLAVEALGPGGRGGDAVIAEALAFLGSIAALAGRAA